MARVTTYTVDETMEQSIEQIRKFLGASSNGEVIRRSIALMKLAVDSADKDKRVKLIDENDGTVQRVPLA